MQRFVASAGSTESLSAAESPISDATSRRCGRPRRIRGVSTARAPAMVHRVFSRERSRSNSSSAESRTPRSPRCVPSRLTRILITAARDGFRGKSTIQLSTLVPSASARHRSAASSRPPLSGRRNPGESASLSKRRAASSAIGEAPRVDPRESEPPAGMRSQSVRETRRLQEARPERDRARESPCHRRIRPSERPFGSTRSRVPVSRRRRASPGARRGGRPG